MARDGTEMTAPAWHRTFAIVVILSVIMGLVGVMSNRSMQPARVNCYGAYWLAFLTSAALSIVTSGIVVSWGRFRPIIWGIIACSLAVFIYSSGYILLCSFLAG